MKLLNAGGESGPLISGPLGRAHLVHLTAEFDLGSQSSPCSNPYFLASTALSYQGAAGGMALIAGGETGRCTWPMGNLGRGAWERQSGGWEGFVVQTTG